MALKRLLDTNAYTALLNGRKDVVETIRSAEEILFSSVVLGELLAGFRGGTRFVQNLRRLDEMLAAPEVRVVQVGRITADRYSRVLVQLRLAGTPIPTNDVWIAAHVFETGAELVTLDSHFGRIQGLPLAAIAAVPEHDE